MDYKLEAIPRTDKGEIKLDEYREKLWYRQELVLGRLTEMNGSVKKHEGQINTITTYGKVLGTLWGLVLGIVGVIWKTK